MVLVQPALKKDHAKSVAKGECVNCGEQYEYTVLLNPERRNKPEYNNMKKEAKS